MVDYRDPKTKTNMNFAKPVVDIAASSRSQAGAKLASWGCSLTLKKITKNMHFESVWEGRNLAHEQRSLIILVGI